MAAKRTYIDTGFKGDAQGLTKAMAWKDCPECHGKGHIGRDTITDTFTLCPKKGCIKLVSLLTPEELKQLPGMDGVISIDKDVPEITL
ncbi:MAG: hypothetical protein M1353_12495 [Nitrospirae bacterium]|nr:hypothetical protein [Nitrospirota bacterium]